MPWTTFILKRQCWEVKVWPGNGLSGEQSLWAVWWDSLLVSGRLLRFRICGWGRCRALQTVLDASFGSLLEAGRWCRVVSGCGGEARRAWVFSGVHLRYGQRKTQLCRWDQNPRQDITGDTKWFFSVSSKSLLEKWVPVGLSLDGLCLSTAQVVAGLCGSLSHQNESPSAFI